MTRLLETKHYLNSLEKVFSNGTMNSQIWAISENSSFNAPIVTLFVTSSNNLVRIYSYQKHFLLIGNEFTTLYLFYLKLYNCTANNEVYLIFFANFNTENVTLSVSQLTVFFLVISSEITTFFSRKWVMTYHILSSLNQRYNRYITLKQEYEFTQALFTVNQEMHSFISSKRHLRITFHCRKSDLFLKNATFGIIFLVWYPN